MHNQMKLSLGLLIGQAAGGHPGRRLRPAVVGNEVGEGQELGHRGLSLGADVPMR